MTSVRQTLEVTSPNKYDASYHTHSTTSISSEEMSPTNEITKMQEKRRRPRKSKNTGRQMLVDLVASEMTSRWLDSGEKIPSLDQPSGPAGIMSAEDLFYAQLNGEFIDKAIADDNVDPVGSKLECSVTTGLIADDDDCSFGALTIPEELRSPQTKKPERRSSVTSGSKGSSRGKSSQKGSVSSKRNSLTGTSIDCSSRSSGSEVDNISAEEIQEFVMKNMPPEVRNKIPKEAWAQIFGKSLEDKILNPPAASSDKLDVKEDEDDSSEVSDITEFTMHPGAIDDTLYLERELTPAEVEWDEEVCPGFETPSSKALDCETKSKSSSGSGTSYMLDHTGTIRSLSDGGKVKFSHVEVRYYERILEINPSVTDGPAVGIGWKFKRGGSLDLDDWELQRGGNVRRSNDLIMPRLLREKILKDAGYNQSQIAEAVRIIRKAKDRRKVTVQNLGGGTEAMEETVEAASRKIKGLLSFGRNQGLVRV